MARFLIVDDNGPFRKALRSLIEDRKDWVVCSEAVNGREAVQKHGQHTPCLTVMDFNMPILDGLAASRLIVKNCAEAKILMVTVFTSAKLQEEAKQAGIKGFCAKTNPECLTEAIDVLLQGGTYFHSAMQASA
jgi:DNA-binding NarL/FixJ family response regulator